MAIFLPLFEHLNEANVRYIVVGGLAVVLHGHTRLTVDVDLVVDLDAQASARAIQALMDLGLQPRVPVNAVEFTDPEKRKYWATAKNLQVLSFFDPNHPLRVVDVFVEYPIEFDQLWQRSLLVPLGTSTVRIASIADLIEMKRKAGRAQDLLDIEALEQILQIKKENV